ncbi:uncharacterized protein B0H18DRAFT_1040349 [Fomitopsis serialis]|uniref:uncharacterized protein n=1 Tax=Fomitopsis serialis TaxID=139415 RepID=UPI0020088963|nr:uncharacterized protein B0H18DRAFT_1040349 [Neoantrodia serialis]KAH9915669.1 hypothetical protein B0H18DRAFT_1040349 [Neoantrodia serialis]
MLLYPSSSRALDREPRSLHEYRCWSPYLLRHTHPPNPVSYETARRRPPLRHKAVCSPTLTMRLTVLSVVLAIASTFAAPIDRDDLRGRAIKLEEAESTAGTAWKAISLGARGWALDKSVEEKERQQEQKGEYPHLARRLKIPKIPKIPKFAPKPKAAPVPKPAKPAPKPKPAPKKLTKPKPAPKPKPDPKGKGKGKAEAEGKGKGKEGEGKEGEEKPKTKGEKFRHSLNKALNLGLDVAGAGGDVLRALITRRALVENILPRAEKLTERERYAQAGSGAISWDGIKDKVHEVTHWHKAGHVESEIATVASFAPLLIFRDAELDELD